jgi:hypothetical protein
MVYAPGHSQRTNAQPTAPRRYRTRRERLSVQVAAVLVLVLIGLVVFSLTNHQRHSGNGCIDFNYTTMIGGAEMYKCGAQARTLCATPRGGSSGRSGGTASGSVDTDFTSALRAACRRAGIAGTRG